MTWLDAVPKFFWYGSIALEALLCWQLFAASLWREYPKFTLFAGAMGVESLGLAVVRPYGQTLYGEVWIVTRCAALVLESLTAIEIFTRRSRHFPGTVLAIGALAAVSSTLRADAMRGGWVLVTRQRRSRTGKHAQAGRR